MVSDDKLAEIVDHQRWLINSGLLNAEIKNNLFLYGAIVHKDITDVYMQFDPERKELRYTLFATKRLMGRLASFNELKNADSFWELWKLKRLLKKEGNLNFKIMIQKFVRDYCGDGWRAEVKVIDEKENKEDYREPDDQRNINEANKQPD